MRSKKRFTTLVAVLMLFAATLVLAGPASAAPPSTELFKIGEFDGSVAEFSLAPSRLCEFDYGVDATSDFPGEFAASDANVGDARWAWACDEVTINFDVADTYVDSRLTFARMGGEDSQVLFDGAVIGDTTGSNPGVDPNPSVSYFFIPGSIDPGSHTITIKGLPTPAWADGYHWVDALLLEGDLLPSGAITSPAVGEILFIGDTLHVAASYVDDDPGAVQWAVRKGTCAAGTNTVAGNVDGFSTPYQWDGASFSAMIDTSGWAFGDYCFVFNPTEEGSEPNLRLTREFSICDEIVTDLVYGRKNIDVGDISVRWDATDVFVTFEADAPWVIYKTHVEFVPDEADLPQNNGGLIPGQFTYGSGPYVPGVTGDTITFPIPAGGLDEYVMAFHAELLEVSAPGYYWGDAVLPVDPVTGELIEQGLRRDGTAVLAGRSDASAVLGVPDGSTANGGSGFYSLGFGGSVIVAFDGWIYNSASPYEFAGVEITGGNQYPEETAKVEFLYDGEWYLAAGELTNAPVAAPGVATRTYVQLPDAIPYAEAVKITDTSDPDDFTTLPDADGYDLDAVKARRLVLSEESGWGLGETVGRNWSMYFDADLTCGCVPG